MFPGVHAGLAGLQAAFDVLEALSTPQGAPRDVRHSIQVLPFSPFTQAVPPHVVAEPSGMNFVETARGADGRGTADPCVNRPAPAAHTARRFPIELPALPASDAAHLVLKIRQPL